MTRKPTGNRRSDNDNTRTNKKKNKRGASKPVPAIAEPEARPIIVIEGGTFRREPWKRDSNLALCIGQIVRRYYPGGGILSYKDWDDRLKRLCFREFLKRYNLHQDVDEDEARRLFNTRAAERFKDNMKDERKRAIGETGSFDPKDWMNFESRWIARAAWRELCLVWARKSWRQKFERNTENRVASDDVAFSTTGSMTVLDHKYQMEKENGGKKPTVNELFVRTHTKKGTNQFVSSKAQRMNDAMNEALKDKYGDDSTQHPDWDVNTWLEVVGGRPHGHAYGLGSAVNSNVQREPNSTQSQQVHQPPGYLDTETVEKLIPEKLVDLDLRHKEREEEQKREFEEREARRNREYQRDIQQAIPESQMMFIQAITNRNMDGASSSRPLRADKAPIEGSYYHGKKHQRNTHHQSNWYESDYDVSDNEDEDEIIFQTDDEE